MDGAQAIATAQGSAVPDLIPARLERAPAEMCS